MNIKTQTELLPNSVIIKKVKIFIDSHLHLCFNPVQVIFVKTYKLSEIICRIEITLQNSSKIELEYNDEVKWHNIIETINKYI